MNYFPMVIAHRGASNIAPENTLPAFSKAIEMGCDGIELDVHLSKDEHIMVIHDDTLNRTTNGIGNVNNYTLPQLKTLDASKLFSGNYSKAKIPTLDEVFQLVLPTNVKVTVELKGNYAGLADKVVALIKEYNLNNRVTISSYNHDYLRHIKNVYPNILTEVDFFVVFEDVIKLGQRLKVDVLCGDYKFVEKMCKLKVKRIKMNKLKLIAYTVDNQEIMHRLIYKGIDGIMTNRPDLMLDLKKCFKSKKKWF